MELNKEKGKLEDKMTELEVRKTTVEAKAKLYETQIVALEEQKNSLAASLKTTMEQKDDIEPLKKHALMLRKKIHPMQLQMVEERFKVQQIDIRLEEIVNTTSYFLDRIQDILETRQGRMTCVETNKKSPADISFKDMVTVKLEYNPIEFASEATELLKNTIKKSKEAYIEFCRRVLLTYNRCQTSAAKRLEVLLEHEMFVK